MRGTSPSLAVEVGPDPCVIEDGPSFTTVRLGNAQITLHGSLTDRRALVTELAGELGMQSRLTPAIHAMEARTN